MNTETPIVDADLADIDRHFAKFIGQFDGDHDVVERAALLLSRSIRQGHICLELRDPLLGKTSEASKLGDLAKLPAQLEKSRAFGGPEGSTPIVIDGSHRLYLRRYWDYQQSLAEAILRKAARNRAPKDESGTQKAAIDATLQNFITIISGGPGTGKTTTVLQILERFLHQPGGDRLRIKLAAPTGKAAARLQELLRATRENPNLDPRLKELMPQSASTIQRLLGFKADSVYFQHDARNPLPLDVLVVDEASMVALPLMAKLFAALPENARVILLGDRDQLASVEPGAVLVDMAEAATVKDGPLQGALLVLSKNYRFGNENAIFKLSSAVRTGNLEEALNILRESSFQELGSAPVPPAATLETRLEETVVEQYKAYLSEKEPAKALAALQRFRVLSALREGPFGVKQINRLIEAALHKCALISDPSRGYAGMPILVIRNDYQTRLFNGDVGILLPDPADVGSPEPTRLWAWFIGEDNELRRLSPGRLPEYELAYAMTVHKSQGSEFDRVLLVLPDRDSPVLTRELVYTGVTRASKRVDIWFDEEVFRASVSRKAVRASGLRDALAPNTSPVSPPLEQGLLL
jgi:exodeoxyribonuclease V alpha subunit